MANIVVMLAQTELLNDVQREAVEHTDGPVLIFAGAGSGKTRVLTHRIAYLLEKKKVFPDRILAVTFTNKAAGEMKSRLERMVGAAARDLWVGTFHSMCVRMLRRDGRKIGISPNFAIMDDADQRAIVREVIADLDYDERQIAPGAALAEISKAKNNLLVARAVRGEEPLVRRRALRERLPRVRPPPRRVERPRLRRSDRQRDRAARRTTRTRAPATRRSSSTSWSTSTRT